jgi:hypothetical protein
MAEAVAQRDRHLAGQHDEHAGSRHAGLEQASAIGIAPGLAEAVQPSDLVGCQRRKGLVIAGAEGKACPGLPILAFGHARCPVASGVQVVTTTKSTRLRVKADTKV